MKTRKRRTMKTYKTFLIFCEGKTEKDYFDSIPKRGKNITVKGIGKGTSELFKKAKNLSKEFERKNDITFDEKWLVFDKDDFDDFDDAINDAQKEGFEVAYSNPCFEIWFLLHFQYIDSSLNSNAICDKVCKLIGNPCQRCEDIKSRINMYEILSEDQLSEAIKHAEKLLSKFANVSPSKSNPSTRVHLLVGALKANNQINE